MERLHYCSHGKDTKIAVSESRMPKKPRMTAAEKAAIERDEQQKAEKKARQDLLTAPIHELYRQLPKRKVDVQSGRDFIHRFYDSWGKEDYFLPPWQREFVWTDEQKLSFYNRIIMDGGFFGSVIIWRRRSAKGLMRPQYLILDGQQRLTSMGVPMRRYDGQMQSTSLPTWDSSCMKWGWGSPDAQKGVFTLPQIMDPYKLAMKLSKEMEEDAAVTIVAHLLEMTDRTHEVDIVLTRIDTCSLPMGEQTKAAIQIFQDMNRGGTPISEDNLQNLIGAARAYGDDW